MLTWGDDPHGVKIGAVFPQTRFADDTAAVREFAVTADLLGYSHLLAYDHVLGAAHAGRDFKGTYDEWDPFHEPLVLFGYFAGITSRIELVTGILVLPQRQTALVAKQAAEVDLLSGGRLRLGVGVGWNDVEYEALNEEFARRGTRSEEQVELLRQLWTEPLVDYEGRWHRVDRAAIFPRPRRSIPVWIGGFSDVALRRAARLADGFIFGGIDESTVEQLQRLRGYLADQGRESDSFGLQCLMSYGAGRPDEWRRSLDACSAAGVTHVAMQTIDAGFTAPQDHIDALEAFAEFAAATRKETDP
jgi:probable F420-dependent oxidoreductase